MTQTATAAQPAPGTPAAPALSPAKVVTAAPARLDPAKPAPAATFTIKSPAAPANVAAPVAQLLALDQVKPDPAQPRKHFDETALQELAASIKANGLLQPVLVRPNGTAHVIIDGERRYRAAKIAGLTQIPTLIRADLKDQDVTSQQLVANLQSEDLTLAEQCDAVARLVKTIGFKETCARLGKSESWVSKRTGVMSMPEPIRKLVQDGKVVDIEIAGHLKQIQEVSPDAAADAIRRIAKPTDWEARQGAVTREDTAQWLEQARRRAEYEKERVEREAKEAARAEREAKAAKSGKVSAAQLEQRQEDRVKDRRKQLREQLYASLAKSLDIKPSDLGHYDSPITIDYDTSDFYAYGGAKAPTSAGACKFKFNASGPVEFLRRAAAGFTKPPKVEVEVPTLTLDQAERLEKALKDVKDIDLRFRFEDVTGNQLADAAKRLTKDKKLPAALTDLLPPPAKPADKKAAPAKGAARKARK